MVEIIRPERYVLQRESGAFSILGCMYAYAINSLGLIDTGNGPMINTHTNTHTLTNKRKEQSAFHHRPKLETKFELNLATMNENLWKLVKRSACVRV
jgi:hypothetical protein